MRTSMRLGLGAAILVLGATAVVLVQMHPLFAGDELDSWMAQRRFSASVQLLRTLREMGIETPTDLIDLAPEELLKIEKDGFPLSETVKLRRWRRILEELRGQGNVGGVSASSVATDLRADDSCDAQLSILTQTLSGVRAELKVCAAKCSASSERNQLHGPAPLQAAPTQAPILEEIEKIAHSDSGASGAECTAAQARTQLIRMLSEVMKTSPELCEDDIGWQLVREALPDARQFFDVGANLGCVCVRTRAHTHTCALGIWGGCGRYTAVRVFELWSPGDNFTAAGLFEQAQLKGFASPQGASPNRTAPATDPFNSICFLRAMLHRFVRRWPGIPCRTRMHQPVAALPLCQLRGLRPVGRCKRHGVRRQQEISRDVERVDPRDMAAGRGQVDVSPHCAAR